MRKTWFFIVVLSSLISFAGTHLLDQVSESYRNVPMVILSVKKTVNAELLGKETSIEGKMTTGKGLFRWESDQPDKVLIVFDGQYLWNVQYPSADFGGDIQVTKARIDKKNKAQILPALILSNEPITTHFEVLNEDKKNETVHFDLKAKSKDFVVQKISMKVNSTNKEIQEISFKDELGSTTFSFLKSEKQKKFSQAPFVYKPEKGAKVTTL